MTMHISLIPRLRGTRETCLSSHTAWLHALYDQLHLITDHTDRSADNLNKYTHNSISQVLQVLQLVATITTTKIIANHNTRKCGLRALVDA